MTRSRILPVALFLVAGTSLSLALVAVQPPQPQPQPAPATPPAPTQPAPDQPTSVPPVPAPVPLPTPTPTPTAPAGPMPDQPVAPVPQVPAQPMSGPAVQKPATDELGRRKVFGEPTKLGFRNVTVDQVIPFIVESTGKVVMPQQDVMARRITLLNDNPIPRERALDLVFLALQQVGVAVIEQADVIMLRDIGDVHKQLLPVLGGDVRVADRRDVGTVVQKVFSLKHATAANIGEVIKPTLADNTKMSIDSDSNQVVLVAPIAELQKVEHLIETLDKPAAASLVTETFRLKFADADLIAQNIRDLFSQTGQVQGQGGQGQQGRPGQGQQGRQGQQLQQGLRQGQAGAASTSANLRVTTNQKQNSVTVLAEQTVVEKIREQIEQFWDKELSGTIVTPKVYQLKAADPIRMKEVLDGLFGPGSQTATSVQFGQRNSQLTQAMNSLAGQFSFQALPEARQLIAVSKSSDNMKVIDQLIELLDRPVSTGMPDIIELKHATAEDLAEQLNALLAQEGTLASVRRVNTNLASGGASAISPFSSNATTSTTAAATTPNQNDLLQFWWQRARPPTDNSGASNLVSKIRLVPDARRNAVMVMAPAEYREAVVQLIHDLDKPGRQVLIAAVIVELTGEDATALGFRFSNSVITPKFQDAAIGLSGQNAAGQPAPVLQGTRNSVLGNFFDTSVLNVGVNVNVLLQALNQNTKVTILSEPRIFTGDNQEADFFDGQDIPFITDSQVNTQGNIVQSFDYRAVGIQLRVRPRITPERNVDLKVNLQLASLSPQTTTNGAFIVDRRETTTQSIVEDGQTIVISGIMRSEDSDVKRKIPILGDIPLLGLAFQSTERVKTNTELVAFITPFVVENRAEMDRNNTSDRKLLDQRRNQVHPPSPKPGDDPQNGQPAPRKPTPTIQPADQTGH